MDLQEKLVRQGLLGRPDLRAEGEQELQACLALMGYQVELDLRGQLVLRVFRDFLAHLVLMAFLVCQVHFKILTVTFFVLPSAPQDLLVHLECQDSRATLGTKEIKES